MSKEIDYPQHIADRIPVEWGRSLSVPEEWYSLICSLDSLIASKAPDYVVRQVKIKFGGLRYYVDRISVPDVHWEYVTGAITLAEALSFHLTAKK